MYQRLFRYIRCGSTSGFISVARDVALAASLVKDKASHNNSESSVIIHRTYILPGLRISSTSCNT